jgi:hypothetical protein
MREDYKQQLIEFASASSQNRRMTFVQLSATFLNAVYGVYTIRSTLRRLGYSRYTARQKPAINEATRARRLAWALEHVNWSILQWMAIL